MQLLYEYQNGYAGIRWIVGYTRIRLNIRWDMQGLDRYYMGQTGIRWILDGIGKDQVDIRCDNQRLDIWQRLDKHQMEYTWIR